MTVTLQIQSCILKKPKTDDFRVQTNFGGTTTKVIPTEDLQKLSEEALGR